jgi:hypothetical protein
MGVSRGIYRNLSETIESLQFFDTSTDGLANEFPAFIALLVLKLIAERRNGRSCTTRLVEKSPCSSGLWRLVSRRGRAPKNVRHNALNGLMFGTGVKGKKVSGRGHSSAWKSNQIATMR